MVNSFLSRVIIPETTRLLLDGVLGSFKKIIFIRSHRISSWYGRPVSYYFFMFHCKKTYLKQKSLDFLDNHLIVYVRNLNIKEKSLKSLFKSHFLAFKVKRFCSQRIFSPVGSGGEQYPLVLD
jgi:hypothetical protein